MALSYATLRELLMERMGADFSVYDVAESLEISEMQARSLVHLMEKEGKLKCVGKISYTRIYRKILDSSDRGE